jgi:DNA-binding transcriptional MerR regulator
MNVEASKFFLEKFCLTCEPVPTLILRFESAEVMKKDVLSSGELAQAAGISRDTLRYYEKKGVLARPRRSPGGYREYPAQAIERVRLIQQAMKVGFTLEELARILKSRDQGGSPCREVRGLAETKLAEIEARLQEILSMRDTLRGILEDWDARLTVATKGKRAALLESLANIHLPVEESLTSRWPKRKKKGRNKANEQI